MKYWCSYFVDLTQKQNSQVIKNPKMDEEFEKYYTVFEYYTTRRLHQYFFVFLQSVSRQIGQKKSQQTLLQLTMDLIIKGTSGGSFVVMASYAPVPFSFYLQQEKKTQSKKQKPQTLFYSIALLSTSRREMSMPSLQFQINYAFLKCTLSSRVGFFKV